MPLVALQTSAPVPQANPRLVDAAALAGEIVPETGGVRKLRWALPERGKRGGARVIYYFHNENVPVFLLSAYAKNQKENLTKAERNEIRRLIPLLSTN